jgi:hypothetical protein
MTANALINVKTVVMNALKVVVLSALIGTSTMTALVCLVNQGAKLVTTN